MQRAQRPGSTVPQEQPLEARAHQEQPQEAEAQLAPAPGPRVRTARSQRTTLVARAERRRGRRACPAQTQGVKPQPVQMPGAGAQGQTAGTMGPRVQTQGARAQEQRDQSRTRGPRRRGLTLGLRVSACQMRAVQAQRAQRARPQAGLLLEAEH